MAGCLYWKQRSQAPGVGIRELVFGVSFASSTPEAYRHYSNILPWLVGHEPPEQRMHSLPLLLARITHHWSQAAP